MRRTVLLTISFAITALAYAQTPNTISFQGSLNLFGTTTPVADGNYDITFELFDDVNNSLWTETQLGVPVTNGLISVQLGSVTALEIDNFYQPLQLEIEIAGETLSPRIALSTVPFAQTSKAVVGTDSVVFRLANQKAGILDQTNTALGFGSFTNEQGSGFFNEAIGTGALASNNGGSQNVAIGSYALGANTTGNTNIAIGYEALNVSSTSRDNVAVGPFALRNNTDGIENVGVGRDALMDNTTGTRNTAMGIGALGANLITSENTAIGASALEASQGIGNTAIGSGALSGQTFGELNVAVGYNAGAGDVGVVQENGTFNTLIGPEANVGVDNLINATAIGFQAVVSQNNSMVLGNNNVNVGIGTSAPSQKLSVNGNIASSGTITADGFTYNSPVEKYYSISAGAFTHLNYNDTQYMSGSVFGTRMYDNSATTGFVYLFASVHLPQDAIVTRLDGYVIDNTTDGNIQIDLIRNVLSSSSNATSMASASTTTDLTTVQTLTDTTIIDPTIDNSVNSYVVAVRMRAGVSTNSQLTGVRITYRDPGR